MEQQKEHLLLDSVKSPVSPPRQKIRAPPPRCRLALICQQSPLHRIQQQMLLLLFHQPHPHSPQQYASQLVEVIPTKWWIFWDGCWSLTVIYWKDCNCEHRIL